MFQVLKAMSRELPETEAEMMSLPGVTGRNIQGFGKKFLDTSTKYAMERREILEYQVKFARIKEC
jgi:superfamily II DNA helicase RecQ